MGHCGLEEYKELEKKKVTWIELSAKLGVVAGMFALCLGRVRED